MSMRHFLTRMLVASSFGAISSVPALSQHTITLEGSAKGEGATIVGAQVTVVNVATRESARAATRANGEFRVLGLFSGRYTVNVRAIGFR